MVRKTSGNTLFLSLLLILILLVQSDASRPTPAEVVVGKKDEAKSNYEEMKNLPPFPLIPFPNMPFAPPLQLPPLPFTPPFGVPSSPPFSGLPLPPFPFPRIPFLSPPPH
ncbi:hypothetical protein V6N13_093114 [Hibiscus sabdariffa]|uniref:Uncharacterized protein n=2 Tax=Hibiscus sabdariffa TaxID=183260 RepID=A0ABR1ZSB2_9ROSI